MMLKIMDRLPIFLKARHQSRPTIWVLFFTLLGFGLRLQRLSFQPLWGDEGWSFYLALQPVPELLTLTAIDIHPPLYYLLLKMWLFLAGVGPEAARLLSVMIGTALIPTLFILGKRLFNRRAGVLSAAIVSLMPLAIYYAQEVRMYGLVTWLGALSTYFFAKLLVDYQFFASEPTAQDPVVRRDYFALAGYVVTMTAALYTHYYAGWLLLFQGGHGLLIMLRQKRSIRQIAQALTPLIVTSLLFLPWVIFLGTRLTDYIENKRDVEGYLPLNPIRFFGDHFVAFSLGHLPIGWGAYVWAAFPFVLLASLGFIAALYFNKNRPYLYLFLYLFVPLFIGYGINLIFPFNPPFFERTLLLVAPAYWLFMAAGLNLLWERQVLLTGGTVVGIVLLMGVSLLGFYNTPRYPDADYRPLLRDIAARATPDDTILASYQWQLGFYQAYLSEPRPRLFAVPGWGEGWAGQAGQPQLEQDLARIFATSPRLWFPAYQASGHIWEDEAEAMISHMGYPALLSWYSPQTKLTLTGATRQPLKAGPTANFSDRLLLISASVGDEGHEAGRGVIPIALQWHKTKSLGSEHQVSLRLADGTGRTWATRDSRPQGGQARFTDLTVGDVLDDRHGLLVSAGLPPGSYRLFLSVRRVSDAHPLDLLDEQGQPLGAELLLADVTVIEPSPPVDVAALPIQFSTSAIFGEVVRLAGYSLGHGPFKAGQPLPVTLFWQSLIDTPEPVKVQLQLQDLSGQSIVTYQQPPTYASSNWRHGTLLRDPHDISLPPTLLPGEYQLTLALVKPDETPLLVAGQSRLRLTTVATVDRPHTFEPPAPQIDLTVIFGGQARLVGLDLPRTEVRAGETLPLTLYWQGLERFDRSWKVFVHLVDSEGQIISQQDQIPGGGLFPTTSWLPDEYLTDSYTLQLPPDVSPGRRDYRLRIGLYDADDFSRLPVIEAGEIVSDHLILDNWEISVQ